MFGDHIAGVVQGHREAVMGRVTVPDPLLTGSALARTIVSIISWVMLGIHHGDSRWLLEEKISAEK